MASIRCKMCGGALEISGSVSVAECEYCGSRQTVPNIDDEKKAALFERANSYRSNNEFDKASVIYESIVAENPKNSEAHWGLCLCRYGIEYVQDARTQKRIPTCHRTQFKSILQDNDYLTAVENADLTAREVYTSEAQYIDKVQKEILNLCAQEDPYHIFICYKETDENGDRTVDSVIAQEIYDELTDLGYKVFFSRITLEDKLGTAYEPYIFAALNSAEVMLAVGTRPEFYNAVWVKNEWGRFISMAEQGQKKTVIPCYRNMTPDMLPREFSALQAQDVSKIGWKQDLIRGIKKIIPLDGTAVVGAVAPMADSSLPAGLLRNSIKRIIAKGAADSDDVWPRSAVTSTINKDEYPCVSFQATLAHPAEKEGDLVWSLTVYDELDNIIFTDESTLHLHQGDDTLAKVWIISGEDGSTVNDGSYRASICINRADSMDYRFRITSDDYDDGDDYEEEEYEQEYVQPQPQPVYKKQKSVLLYLVLLVLGGGIGLHCFYAGRIFKGIFLIILTITGVAAPVTFIICALDFLKAIIKRRVPTKK